MSAKTLMVQGTASSVGKSTLVAALCRILRQEGWKVAPFKAQNMSLNSHVTPDGLEIGRAQAVQAEAAGLEPAVEMNPILLKPEADDRCQIIVKGRPMRQVAAADYASLTDNLWATITECCDILRARYDVVVIEGAGSPAEVNLKERDLVNMRVALYCGAPVLLVADIDRGGIFASLIGTLELLERTERAAIGAFVINKFRGDYALLKPGIEWLEQRTGVPVAGVIPYFHDIHIAEEDSVSLEKRRAMKLKSEFRLDIAVIALPHIANFDDFDPLEREDGVRLRYVEGNDDLEKPDLIILPGTKSTIADLDSIKWNGTARKIIDRALSGTAVIGICGGYQMMGEEILDPQRAESSEPRATGLGLLPVTTIFSPGKSTHQVRGRVRFGRGLLQGAAGLLLSGYEIHMGQTNATETSAAIRIEERSRKPCEALDGCLSADGYLLGTYIHGLFHNERLRDLILRNLAARRNAVFHPSRKVLSKEEQYDRLADLARRNLNMKLIHRMMNLK